MEGFGDAEGLVFGEVAFAAEPVLHGGLQGFKGDAGASFHEAVGDGEGVVEDGVVGEVAHSEVVDPADGTGVGVTGGGDAVDVEEAGEHPDWLSEEGELNGVQRQGLDGAGEAAGALIASEDGDGGGVLIAADKPVAGGIQGEVARGFAAAGYTLQQGEGAGGVVNGKGDKGVFPTVGDVDEAAAGSDGDLSGGVGAAEAGIQGADGVAGVGKEGLRREAMGDVAAGGVEEELVDVVVKLGDGVDPAAVGVEGEVARAGAGAALVDARGA